MEFTTLALLACYIVHCHVVICEGADVQDVKNLTTKLFTTDGYEKRIKPSANQSDPIYVYVDFYLLSVNELNEVTETMKTTGYLWMNWEDEYLSWTPADYGNLESFYWPQADVWKPDIALKNSALEYKELGVSTLNVYIENSGNVVWYPFQVFQSTCSVDITFYPFDVQECEMQFVAWSYTAYDIELYSGSNGIVMDEFQTNSEWDVLNTSVSTVILLSEASITFKIKLQRKPLYVLLSVILPIMMLALLNIFVFILPCESGEKASYAMTVFLAFAVFLSIISSTFPENSETIAIFSMYLIVLTLQSTVITLLALVMIRLNSFDTPVPRCIQSCLRALGCRPCRERHQHTKVDSFSPLSSTKKLEVKQNVKIPIVRNVPAKRNYTWKEAVNSIDRILFILFIAIFIVSTTVFFVVAADGSNKQATATSADFS